MIPVYLTPASISYLNLFLAAVGFTGYLGWRIFVRGKTRPMLQDTLMFLLTALVALLSITLFGELSTLSGESFLAVIFQNPLVSLLLIVLSLLAYHDPAHPAAYRLEKRLAFAFNCAYALLEVGFGVFRLSQYARGHVLFRPVAFDWLLAFGFLWTMTAFVRQSLHSRTPQYRRRLWWIAALPVLAALANLANTLGLVSTAFYQAMLSVGALTSLHVLVLNYLGIKPEATPINIKITAIVVMGWLVAFGLAAWILFPGINQHYRSTLRDQVTLRFSPNSNGGYDIRETGLHFRPFSGRPLQIDNATPFEVSAANVDFPLRLFGQSFDRLYIAEDGYLLFGERLADFHDIRLNFSSAPAIFALLSDLDLSAGPQSGIFLDHNPDQLIVTYSKLRAREYSEIEYTFQIVLYRDGSFDLNYADLSFPREYIPENPAASVWAIGVKPAGDAPQRVDFADLPLSGGPQGILHDEARLTRIYQHQFIFPLAAAAPISGLFLTFVLPIVFNVLLTRPLNLLIEGVKQMNEGQLSLVLPVTNNDEIGFLTGAFNKMACDLNDLIKTLDKRVALRTASLGQANEQLLKLTVAVEQNPQSIIITDRNGIIEYVNSSFCYSTGYSAAEVLGKTPNFLKSELTEGETIRQMMTSIQTGLAWRGELRNRRKDGSIYWDSVLLSPIRGAEDQITHYVSIQEDITARKQIEQDLLASEKQYRELFDLETDAIFIYDHGGKAILEANRAATVLYGYSNSDYFGMDYIDLMADRSTFIDRNLLPAPVDGVIVIPIQWHRKKDGTIFPVEITMRFFEWQGQPAQISANRDITARYQSEKELERLAITDGLTEVFNRRYFFAEAERRLIYPHQSGSDAAVMMMDIDRFKRINDTYGHQAGDIILKEIAARLGDRLRPTDLFARYGGEEFIALLLRTPREEVGRVAERLLAAVNCIPASINELEVPVTISLGVATLDPTVASIDDLVSRADQALYAAKRAGRNRVVFWHPNIEPK